MRSGLARRYLIVLVALVTGALVAAGAIQLRTSYTENQAALVALQTEKAHGAAARIEAFVRDIERQLTWTTHAPLLTTDAALDARQLDALRLQRQAPPITELTYIDASGREQLFVSRLVPDRRRSNLDVSQEPKFTQARAGKAWFGPVYFRKDSEPYMTISAPLTGGGVVAADVNLKFILDVVSQIKVGKTGLALAVDGKDDLIAHPDISLVLQKTNLGQLPQVRAARTPSADDDLTIARDLKGVEVLTAHSRISSLGWIVFVEQPVTEALAPVRASAYRVVYVVLAGIALSVVVSVVLARRLARPIQALQQSAARIGAGELDHQIALRTGDELEALAGEFNRMTSRLRESYATLEQKVEDRTHELSESLEQQTATAEILRVISASPTDVHPVFEAILANATRLCAAERGIVFTYDGQRFLVTACRGLSPEAEAEFRSPDRPTPTQRSGLGRMLATKRPVQVEDITDDEAYRAGDPLRLRTVRILGARTAVWLPLLKGEDVIGAMTIYRQEVRRFTDKQIEFVQTFADQAVIAIENVRLFKELELRNTDLGESLERQTTTAEILSVISRSPTDLRPVIDAIARSAARLCRAANVSLYRAEGGLMRKVAEHEAGPPLATPRLGEARPITRGSVSGRAILDRVTVQVRDVQSPDFSRDYPDSVLDDSGVRTTVGVPLLREGAAIGAFTVHRTEPVPFSDAEIALLQTFADQAVIAIENVRLFRELEAKNTALSETLEQQTATGEILKAISASPTDVQPVFDAIVRSALRLLDGHSASVIRLEDETLHLAALTSTDPAADAALRSAFPAPLTRGGVAGHVVHTRQPYVVADTETDPLAAVRIRELAPQRGYRSMLFAPMVREQRVVGLISVTRPAPGGFSEDEIALLSTFADQAVIAIENVRLFTELEAKNVELSETLEQQTATGAILRAISGSPTDVEPVFSVIADSALRLLDAHSANVARLIDDTVHLVAFTSKDPASDAAVRANFPIPLRATGVAAHVTATRRPYVVTDVYTDPIVSAQMRNTAPVRGYRSLVMVPILRDERVIGFITATRPTTDSFSEDEIVLLRTFADQAVIAIENVRLFTELQARTAELTRSVGELEALGEVGRAISSTLDLDRVLETIISRANTLSDSEGGAIYEFDEATREFRLRTIQNFPEEFVAEARTAPIEYGRGAVGRAAAERQPISVPDVAALAYQSSTRDLLTRSGYRSLLAVPLLSEDEVVGVLVVNRRVPGEFPPRAVELLRTFGTQSALAIQNARLFREIENKSRELEAANRHKDEFLASMSHELRTPLNAVIGFSEVLLERMFGDVNAKQEEYLNDILASGRHLLSLINDILDLAKIEAGRMELDVEDFDLAPAIDNALVLIRERATRKGLALETRMEAGLGGVRGDQRKIKQVLVNLLSNAVKFTPEGGRIEVCARRADGQAEVSVIDTGIGIASEDYEAVFEEFRQVGTDYAKKHEGTGLGLALARKFVELHGGRIWVKSQPGEGSTFTFTIPVA
jgi:GAF domain-containing protein/HAMP domain-containing protein